METGRDLHSLPCKIDWSASFVVSSTGSDCNLELVNDPHLGLPEDSQHHGYTGLTHLGPGKFVVIVWVRVMVMGLFAVFIQHYICCRNSISGEL